MKKSLLLSTVAAAAMVCSVQAVSIGFNDPGVVGIISPSNPSDDANQWEQVRFLLTSYNSNPTPRSLGDNPADPGPETYTLIPGTGVPAGPLGLDLVEGGSNNGNTIDVGTSGALYLLGKYDGVQGGAILWYIGGLNGEISIPETFSDERFPATTVTVFVPRVDNGVPDGGITLGLLGLGLGALGFAARKRS